ncbi:MAG: hypothetical protein ACPHQT_08730 [Planctomycetota bacterium]
MKSYSIAFIAMCALCISPASVMAGGGASFTISGGGVTVQGTGSADFGIDMDSPSDIEGFVIAVSFDDSLVAVTDVSTAGTVTESSNAELVVPEILSGGFTLGCVLDAAAPFDGQTIAAGSGLRLMNFTAQSVVVLDQADPNEVTGFAFTDGTFNNPPLSNIVVSGGLSIGASNGLSLNDDLGALSIAPPPPATLTIENGVADASGNGSARILMENAGETQGFVLSVTHPAADLTLTGIDLTGSETEATGAEFVVVDVYANGGTVGVVLDFEFPFDGQTIGAGSNLHIANYNYSDTVEIYIEGEAAPADQIAALTFEDSAFGSPPLNNVVVTGGLSINPDLNDGNFSTPPVALPAEDTELWVEADFDGNGNSAYLGETGDLCFYYADEDDNIQGFTMTLCYDCNLEIGSAWDYNGSIVEEVGVEYLAVQVDSDDTDGDGCELIVAILLDALPPFDGQTLPQTADLNEGRLLIGCLPVTVGMGAPCETDLLIEWCNDINGTGSVNLYNNAVINFNSIQNFTRNDGSVFVVPVPVFQRGDCNSDDKVDLADSATMLANQFNGLDILCADACDSNDDGQLNMADSVYLLNWLFKFGPVPSAPGPFNDGADPTEDDLPACAGDDEGC